MKKNQKKLTQKELSPILSQAIKSFYLSKKIKIKNLKHFVNQFSCTCRLYRYYVVFVLKTLQKPIFSTETVLENLNYDLEDLLSNINTVVIECECRYTLTPRQSKMLRYLQQKIEEQWSEVSKLLFETRKANDMLFVFTEDTEEGLLPEGSCLDELAKQPLFLS